MPLYKVSMICNNTPYVFEISAESRIQASMESTIFMIKHATWPNDMTDAEKLKRIKVESVSEKYFL